VNDKTEIALKSDKALHHEDVCGVLLISTLNGSSFHVPAALTFHGTMGESQSRCGTLSWYPGVNVIVDLGKKYFVTRLCCCRR